MEIVPGRENVLTNNGGWQSLWSTLLEGSAYFWSEEEEILMAWREFWSLTSMCYPTPYSFLLFYIDMPLIPPSLRQAREIKTGRNMSLIPSLRADDSVHWRFLLVISKKQHNDLSVCTRPVPHTQHGTQKSLTKRLKELLFLHFFFFFSCIFG